MPRKDRSFSDLDVLRIYNKHLNAEEKVKVWTAFQTITTPSKVPSYASKKKKVISLLKMILDILLVFTPIAQVKKVISIIQDVIDLLEEIF